MFFVNKKQTFERKWLIWSGGSFFSLPIVCRITSCGTSWLRFRLLKLFQGYIGFLPKISQVSNSDERIERQRERWSTREREKEKGKKTRSKLRKLKKKQEIQGIHTDGICSWDWAKGRTLRRDVAVGKMQTSVCWI